MSETGTDAILAEARAIVSDLWTDFSFDGRLSQAEAAEGEAEAVSIVAQALLAAENRGVERERERCAKMLRGTSHVLAEKIGGGSPVELLDALADAIEDGRFDAIASTIRGTE